MTDLVCTPPYALCGQECVDLLTDRRHCGRCARACASEVACDQGICHDQLIASVATSADHTCALRNSGEVLCWGYNYNGQLGDGSTRSRALPRPTRALRDARGLAAGANHSCAWLSRGGELWCWGANEAGQVGDGTITPRLVPSQVLGLFNVGAVGTGNNHTCASVMGDAVWCWGSNFYGQLGDGSVNDRLVPGSPIEGLRDVTMLGAGANHTCALRAGGVLCWGSFSAALGLGDAPRQVRTPAAVPGISDATAIATGASHTCAIRTGGTVWCWGNNYNGEVGDGTRTERSSPVQVLSLANVWQLSVAPGGRHTCALDTEGAVWCWGANECGQLGDGTRVNRLQPVRVDIPRISVIRAGFSHACAVRDAGRGVLCWGSNGDGQLGTGEISACQPMPQEVGGLFEE